LDDWPTWPCAACGTTIRHTNQRGRARKFCDACVPRGGGGSAWRAANPDKVYAYNAERRTEVERVRRAALARARDDRRKGPLEPRPCEGCGQDYVPKIRHRQSRFCSQRCKDRTPERRAHHAQTPSQVRRRTDDRRRAVAPRLERRRQRALSTMRPMPIRRCELCDRAFTARTSRRFCTARCGNRASHGLPAAAFVPEERMCDWCGDAFTARFRSHRFCRLDCTTRASRARRRARKRGADGRIEDVSFGEVWGRDSGLCWLCSEPIDVQAAVPDDLAGTMDHVIPLSRGGGHTFENVRLAHFICNSRRGDRVEAELVSA